MNYLSEHVEIDSFMSFRLSKYNRLIPLTEQKGNENIAIQSVFPLSSAEFIET